MNQPSRTEAAIAELVNAPRPSIKLTLDHVYAFFGALGNPQNHMPPAIHVAGTNGKGSTMAFLRAMYEAQGLRVHSYTSPHLVSFHERIILAGNPINDAYLLELIVRIQPALKANPATFFEATTAVAFLAFGEVPADVLLLEVGMGGRLDTTNILTKKLVSVITPIGMDHAEFLGDSLAKIAAEKAGIMLPHTPVLMAHQPPEAANVLHAHAAHIAAPVIDWSFNTESVQCDDCTIALPQPALLGAHQHENAALAAATAIHLRKHLPITDNVIAKGVQNAHWPARMQHLRAGPLVNAWGDKGEVVLDGAHNVAAAKRLVEHVQESAPITVICGMMKRKDVAAYLATLAPVTANFIAVDIPEMEAECMDSATLAQHAREAGIAHVQATTLENAASGLTDCATDTLIICGSLYLAGAILKNHS